MTVSVLFIPSCLVVVTTIYLLILARQVARRGRESLRRRGIMTTVLTAAVYCVSILPYVVYIVGKSIVTADDHSSSFFHTSYHRIAYSFLYLNTISNFYIYSLSVPSFRDFIRSRIQQTYRIFTSILGGQLLDDSLTALKLCLINTFQVLSKKFYIFFYQVLTIFNFDSWRE